MSMTATRKTRGARDPVPAPEGFESLDKTHREVLEVLKEFEQLLQHLDDKGADEVAKASAKRICEFFAGAARQHHADEERLVFPELLASNDAELVQHVLRLQQDHGWLEEDWLELSPQIEAIAEGFAWYDVDNLRQALPVFTALYNEHIVLEETVVYPEAKRRRAAIDDAEHRRAP